jgi:regulator of sirC expression with transglutaminase-like and TPR domain
VSLEEFDIVEAAMLVAAEEYPELDVDAAIDAVASVAEQVGGPAAAEPNPFARLDLLRSALFDELGFRGNAEDYDDPRNSYLNEVVDRRLGIPITLSILFLEAARVAGFRGRGVALPGHFVIALELGGRRLLVDPYHRGEILTEDDCRDLVSRSTGRATLFRREQLVGVGPRGMLARMLLNLKHVHLGRGDWTRALAAVDRLLLLRPADGKEIRDRGLLKAHLGEPREAIIDLEAYLELAPRAADIEAVQGRVAWLRRKLQRAERNATEGPGKATSI